MDWRRRAVLLAFLLPCSAPAFAVAVPEPDGYRMDQYGAPTPETLHGARVLTTVQAEALWRGKDAIFVDVLPQPPRPEGLAPGTIWRPTPRLDIPGSIWLPDTGYGAPPPPVLDYFAQELARATGGDHHRTLVFYCKPDCWMSWNAAKRALTLGYTKVAWYPGGATDWQKAGLPLAETAPRPRPDATQ